MLKFLIVILFFIPSLSFGQAFVGLGVSGRLVKDNENNFKTKFPVLIYGGYKDLPWAYALEGLYFQDSDNTGASFHMTNKHYEASALLMRFFNYEEARAINPYMVGGFGVFQERLESDFLGTKDKDKSALNGILKAGVGAWAQLGERGFLNIETKLLYSKDFSPEAVIELSARGGVLF